MGASSGCPRYADSLSQPGRLLTRGRQGKQKFTGAGISPNGPAVLIKPVEAVASTAYDSPVPKAGAANP